MFATGQLWFLQRNGCLLRCALPTFAGCSLLWSSVLPWLKDPLGSVSTAWELPIDIGWQGSAGVLNYGLLCLCCALYAFLVAWANWRPSKKMLYFAQHYTLVAVLCLVPVCLFLLQYLCIDLQAMALLARHKTQMILIQRHLGYGVAAPLIPLDPFTLNGATLWGRLQLLLDQVSFGLLPPCVGAWMVMDYRRSHRATLPPAIHRGHHKRTCIAGGLLLLIILLGRAPAALGCEAAARTLLSSGDYAAALNWLDAARFLNPALDQMAYYHIERGQALYLLFPGQLAADERLYLAASYREQDDYLDAYQQDLALWQANSAATWAVDDMSATLERLAEAAQPLQEMPDQSPTNDTAALPWLQLLAKVDPANIYSSYLTGRIQYNLYDYTACIQQMELVIRLSPDADVQSSAYTYMALSEADQGDAVDARNLLLKAVALDPGYRNNTAREALSGLH